LAFGLDEKTGADQGSQKTFVVGITGSSGIIYGIRTVQVLKSLGFKVIVIYTRESTKVALLEHDLDLDMALRKYTDMVYTEEQIEAPPSSSSYKLDGMVIVPCSIRTLAEISSGLTYNLVSRTAANVLRTRGKLVLVIRETPIGVIELRNALTAAEAGAIILPASPGFYSKPKTIQDVIDFVVGKTLDMLNVSHNLYRKWEGASYT
jgi:polyprenyl P-hydroxybenzoate and phenylacrylic acid decarboxylases